MLSARHAGYERLSSLGQSPFLASTSDLMSGFLLQEMLEAFNLVGVGLGIVDAEGRLLHCNGLAESILARRDGLEVTPSRILRAGVRRGSSPRGLLEQLQGREAYGDGQESIAVLPVPRPSGKRPLTVFARSSAPWPDQPNAIDRVTLLLIVDPEIPMDGMKGHVRQVFGLTGAETELAIFLMQGNNLPECCRRMGIRRSTAASHLHQLFKKTLARTQGHLVATLFKRCGLLGAARELV